MPHGLYVNISHALQTTNGTQLHCCQNPGGRISLVALMGFKECQKGGKPCLVNCEVICNLCSRYSCAIQSRPPNQLSNIYQTNKSRLNVLKYSE